MPTLPDSRTRRLQRTRRSCASKHSLWAASCAEQVRRSRNRLGRASPHHARRRGPTWRTTGRQERGAHRRGQRLERVFCTQSSPTVVPGARHRAWAHRRGARGCHCGWHHRHRRAHGERRCCGPALLRRRSTGSNFARARRMLGLRDDSPAPGGRPVRGGIMGSMKPGFRARFLSEGVATWLAASLAVLTLCWREWIEAIFGLHPDRQNGSAEWAIVAALFTVCLVLALAAKAGRCRAPV